MIELVLSLFFIAMMFLYASWLILILIPKNERYHMDYRFPFISIIIPAHNEASIIKETINALINAEYPSNKEIIVVNDGSTDETEEILREIIKEEECVRYINTEHLGKANALNKGLSLSNGDIIITLDADSKIDKNALIEIVKPFSDERVGAVSGIIRAITNRNILTWFQDFEYVLSSGWRYALNRVNSTYIFPGFAAYRKYALDVVGGFNEDTLSEDFDIGIRLKKADYKLVMSNAVIYTKVPQTISGLIKQRIRWGKGTIQVIKKHSDVPFNKDYGATGLYAIPSQMYWFLHGFVVIPLTFYQVFDGYFKYFIAYNNFFSIDVLKYFFSWFSVYGMIDYTQKALMGEYQFTQIFLLAMGVFILGLVYNIVVISKISKMYLRYLFVIFFFFPYSILVLIFYSLPSIIEVLSLNNNKRANIWEKNI